MPRAECLATPVYALVCLLTYGILPAHGLFGQGLRTAPDRLILESGTPVKLQLAQTISSASAHKNDHLDFVVARDVVVGGFTVIRAGARAEGSVVAVKGTRPLAMGGRVTLKLDSVELTTGEEVGLVAHREFRGKSHILRMGLEMAVTAAIYVPATPLFLLSRGRECTVLKGTEITAYTKNDSLVKIEELPTMRASGSEVAEMIRLLPPRVTNGEGRGGDLLNLIFLAWEDELQGAFARAGWLKADRSIPQIIWHLLSQQWHDTKLPMIKLFVFGRSQDYSFVLPEPNFIASRRHHLRIWKTDREVDGVPLWVGAATHDVAIQVVKRKFELLHTIDPNVDAERDFIAGDLAETWPLGHEQYMSTSEPVFRAQTANGQSYYSDSRMLFLDLNQESKPLARNTEIAGK